MSRTVRNCTLRLNIHDELIFVDLDKYTLEEADQFTMQYKNKEELLKFILENKDKFKIQTKDPDLEVKRYIFENIMKISSKEQIKELTKYKSDYKFELTYRNNHEVKKLEVLYNKDKNFLKDVVNFHYNFKSNKNYEKRVITSDYNRKCINNKYKIFEAEASYKDWETVEKMRKDYWEKINSKLAKIKKTISEDLILRDELIRITKFMYDSDTLSEHTKYRNRRIQYVKCLKYAKKEKINIDDYRIKSKEEQEEIVEEEFLTRNDFSKIGEEYYFEQLEKKGLISKDPAAEVENIVDEMINENEEKNPTPPGFDDILIQAPRNKSKQLTFDDFIIEKPHQLKLKNKSDKAVQ